MGIDGERALHNPDRENLKSLLKRPGKSKDKRGNRVVFNENKNEFFDADYIILIREECDLDDEDDDEECTCNQHELVRVACCEPNCNCSVYDASEQTPLSPKFAPPIEFVDAVTLSPPEGYKDMELEEQQLFAFQQFAKKSQRTTTVCKECSEAQSDHEEQGVETKNLENQQHISKATDVCYLDEKEKTSSNDSPINGILKGGKFWKHGVECNNSLLDESQQVNDTDEDENKRSVRFTESEQKNCCDEVSDRINEQEVTPNSLPSESTEMMLTFKLGNQILISSNSLKPNSAVRQLFPCTKPEEETAQQYLITAESLRAFEEAKKSKVTQTVQNKGSNETIKQTIERNTIRRSLIKYEPRSKKNVQKTDNSLVEKIKQLTCDMEVTVEDKKTLPEDEKVLKNENKSFSPSPSSSSTSSNCSSTSTTYRKITELFGGQNKVDEEQNTIPNEQNCGLLPDLGNDSLRVQEISEAKMHSAENRKQFFSTLAPLTACVGGLKSADDSYYQINNLKDKYSIPSSVESHYSLEETNKQQDSRKIAPDVLAGTPSGYEPGDELTTFVRQDAKRTEHIKNKYPREPEDNGDDEHDDYGFNRRPNVRSIKPGLGSTTKILHQIQSQLQPPTDRVAWPYYSETTASIDNLKKDGNQMPSYLTLDARNNVSQYPAAVFQDEKTFSNFPDDRSDKTLSSSYNKCSRNYSAYIKLGESCTEYYHSVPNQRTERSLSPPPLELSKNYHQTIVYIPYNHINCYQTAYQSCDYVKVTNQNQINKQYINSVYQHRIYNHEEPCYGSNVVPLTKPLQRVPLPQNNAMTKSDIPVVNFSTARSTPPPLGPRYYPGIQQYRPMIEYYDCYLSKSRHSFSANIIHSPTDNNLHIKSNCEHICQMSKVKDLQSNLATKPCCLNQEMPEIAATTTSLDTSSNSCSTMTSPTSPQNSVDQKQLFYSMNV